MSIRAGDAIGGPGITRSLTILFAVAGGIAVGNLYLAQPLLNEIAETFDAPTGFTGVLVTVSQLGYALGIFLFVPLGDTLDRSRLIPLLMGSSAIALTVCALAPNFSVLIAGVVALGLTTVAGQLLTPLAGDLARPDQRGRVVGTVVLGVLVGILVSRTISGLVAGAFGWRAIFVLAGVLAVAVAVVLATVLPADPERVPVRYGRLLVSVFSHVRTKKHVQITLVIGATSFAVFSMFWTGLTFLLSAAPFSFSVEQIGFVGLVGLAGALAGRPAGQLHDRGWSVPATGVGLLLALLALAIGGIAGQSIGLVLLAVFVFDVAIQCINVLNQTRIIATDSAARSRLNTAFVTSNFIGGAIGSALASVLWSAGGWLSLMLVAGVLIGFAFTVWFVHRTRGLVPRGVEDGQIPFC